MTKNQARPKGRFTPLMLRALALCPKRFEIEYVQNYRRKSKHEPPWPPNIKTILHDALRERDFATMRGLSSVRTRAAAVSVIEAYRQELFEAIGPVSPQEREQLAALVATTCDDAAAILSHFERVSGRRDPTFMLTEEGRPLVDLVVEERLDDDYTYADRIDAVLDRSEAHLPPAVLVRRFTSNADPGEVIREVEMDLNLPGMAWIASRAAKQKVTTAVIEIVRTKPPSIPETIQCRKCKGTGTIDQRNEDGTYEEGKVNLVPCPDCGSTGIGGMSKKACDTTYELWVEEAQRHGLDIEVEKGRCASTVQRLISRGETFVYWTTIDISEDAIRDWKRDTGELIDFSLYCGETRNVWRRNPAACVLRSGPCPYRRTCAHQDDEDAAWFTVNDDAYPGLG